MDLLYQFRALRRFDQLPVVAPGGDDVREERHQKDEGSENDVDVGKFEASLAGRRVLRLLRKVGHFGVP